MSGGEGSTITANTINDVDTEYNSIKEASKSYECLNTYTKETSATFTDGGIRRRKIINAAKETIDKASHRLRRKIPYTGHLMTPRCLWIQKVPTQECDVVITFPSGSNEETLMWLLGSLRARSPGLTVHVQYHASLDSYGFYLTASFSVLLKVAEEIHLPKRLRQEYGGGLKEFVGSEATYFEENSDETHFFTTQERQSLVLHLLHTLRTTPNDLHVLQGLEFVDGQAIIPKCLSTGIISQVFPLHELPALEKLQRSWVQAFLSLQPLDDISRYFGVKISMYFAWLGHYITALIVPAAVGVIYWVGIIGRNQAMEDVAYVLFSVFNVLWATIYLETWKRRGAELAYRWGTLDQRDDLLLEPRPLFTGTLEISPVTGRLEPTYPRWKRNVFRYLVSVPIVTVCLFFVFIVMILSFQIQDWWDTHLQVNGYEFWLSYVPKVLLAIIIVVMDKVYFKLAVWLNDLENYRLDTEYENHLIYKVTLFQFVNSFLSLFYIAFYIQDQQKLKEQLAALLIARQVIGNLKESAVPYIIEQLRLARLSFELFGAVSPSEVQFLPGETTNSEEPATSTATTDKTELKGRQPRNVSQAELESSLYRVGYPTNCLLSKVTFKVLCRFNQSYDGAFSEHLQMLSQLGYVCLFSSAFPLAAFAALLGNLLELRGDAFKLCFVLQRPFGRRVSNIGTWQNAMEILGLVAILVNCALIGLSGQVQRMFPEMSTTQTILLIVALEHIMLIIRFIIIYAIPDIPTWIATEMAKVEFLRREAVRRLSSSSPSEHQPHTVIGRFVVSPADGVSGNDEKFKQKKRHCVEELSARSSLCGLSQPNMQTIISLGVQSSSGPVTPNSGVGFHGSIAIPKIDETHVMSPETPGSTGSGSNNSSTFLTDGTMGSSKYLNLLPTGNIPGGEKGRKSKEWTANEQESSNGDNTHHLTIGPHGGIDWARRLCLEGGGRKSSESEINDTGINSGVDTILRRSTDCIVSKNLAVSSDSDFLCSIPPWSPTSKNQKVRSSFEKDSTCENFEKHQYQQQLQQMQQYQLHRVSIQEHHDQQLNFSENDKVHNIISDSHKTTSSQEDEKSSKEEREAKKTRVKQSLMKRARSVAIFSLKLKERRAREAEVKAKEAEKEARWQQPQSSVGGELSCIPIEKLISVDDIATMEIRRMNN